MGEIILKTGSIPRVDIFSFVAAGKEFIVQNWLSEIILYLVYRMGGFPLLVFLNTLLLVAALLPVYYLCRKASERFWPSIFSAVLITVCMPCNLRPQVFSFILFSIYYWILEDYRFQRRDRLWLLPVLMIFWVNLHGAFVMGLVLAAVYLFSWFVPAAFDRLDDAKFDKNQFTRLTIILALCVLATLANPEVGRIYRYVWTVLRDPSSQQLVVEWQPPRIGSIQGVFLFYLPFLVGTITLILTRRRVNRVDLALYLLFSILGFSASRNSVYFLLVLAPIISRYIPMAAKTVADLSNPPQFVPIDQQQPHPIPARHYAFVNALLAFAAFALVGIHSPWIQSRFYGKSLIDPQTPVGAMNYIEHESLTGNILHPQIYGDYLIWRLWPKQRSFFDGRVHLFGEAFVRDYQRMLDDPCRQDLLEKYQIRYMLLSKEEDGRGNGVVQIARSSQLWMKVYEDSNSIMFERRSVIH